MESNFLKLSRFLTGLPYISPELAEQHEARMRKNKLPEVKLLDSLIEKFIILSNSSTNLEQDIDKQIMSDQGLRKLVRLIIVLWYTSTLPEEQERKAEYWFQSLLWEVIHAHVPGLSGGYFGHWSYPPDN